MKCLVAPLLLALTTQAHAIDSQCANNLQAEFIQQVNIASNQYPQHAGRFHTITAELDTTRQLSPLVWAQVYPRRNAIQFSEDVCALPASWQAAEVAHELGHIIADAQYPAIYQHELEHPKTHNYAQDEELARYYGAKLLTQQNRNDLVVIFSSKCNNGLDSYCKLRDSWEYGFTH